jgi:uncharacterized protein YcfL
MKKFLAFAFVAGMMAFVACTSKPSEEAADTTAVVVEDTVVDAAAIDTTVAVDSAAADSVK